MVTPLAADQRWSLDFVADQLTDGRRFRILAVVDDCTRECLALIADTSISGRRVARELDDAIRRRGRRPETIVSDNGTELTSNAILSWADETGVGWHYIAGKAAAERVYRELQRAAAQLGTRPVKTALRGGLAPVQRTVFAPVLVTGDGEG